MKLIYSRNQEIGESAKLWFLNVLGGFVSSLHKDLDLLHRSLKLSLVVAAFAIVIASVEL